MAKKHPSKRMVKQTMNIPIFCMIINHCQEQMYTLLSVVSIFSSKKRKPTRKRAPKIAPQESLTSDFCDTEEHLCAPTDSQAATASPPPTKR